MSANHDIGYKEVFGYPIVVRDLLVGFTGLACFSGLDVSAFERVNASYVSERFTERHGDMVWNGRLADHVLFVYLLLEFQSKSEHWMALRMQVYVGLLYQDLVKRGELAGTERLPPVLPVVVYNGKKRWTASEELRSLVAPGPDELQAFQASQRYLLIDQNSIDPADLAQASNIAALLFNCELWPRLGVQVEVSETLLAWLLADDQASLRRSIDAWFVRLQLRETGHVLVDGVGKLLEDKAMAEIAETEERDDPDLGRWEQWVFNRGWVQGLIEGKTAAARDMLKRQLRHRFGSMPESAVAKVDEADLPTLERWVDRVLDASNAEAVFSD